MAVARARYRSTRAAWNEAAKPDITYGLLLAATATVPLGLVVTTFTFGFRHGIDWDHLAAISDLTGSQTNRRRSLVLASLYAGGHALVVLV